MGLMDGTAGWTKDGYQTGWCDPKRSLTAEETHRGHRTGTSNIPPKCGTHQTPVTQTYTIRSKQQTETHRKREGLGETANMPRPEQARRQRGERERENPRRWDERDQEKRGKEGVKGKRKQSGAQWAILVTLRYKYLSTRLHGV